MFTFDVTFYDGFGQNLGVIRVDAMNSTKAKITASELYFCPWVRVVAELVV